MSRMVTLRARRSTPIIQKSSKDQLTWSVQIIAKAGMPSSRRGDKKRSRDGFMIDVRLTKRYKYCITLSDNKPPQVWG